MTHLKVLFHHLPGGTKEIITNLNWDSQEPEVRHEYEARMLSTHL
jgi:hypothetical protein